MRVECAEMSTPGCSIRWPEGKSFAFAVCDDTDGTTLENIGQTYALLRDCGFRTTRSCWSVSGDPHKGTYAGQTCEDPNYLQWVLDLESKGFEISWHGSTWHGLPREDTLSAMARFAEIFHHYPMISSNHTCCEEGMYWGNYRLTGWHVLLYNLLTRYRNNGKYRGHIEGDEYFWGDLCKEKIKYYRNFVFQDINTLKSCPFMPYHDPLRPYVNYWFASSNGADVRAFNKCISERNQERLEAEGGACIMYTHFARGFCENRKINPRFQSLMERLSKKNGWFVPVGTLLDYLQEVNGHHQITDRQRRQLERKWLWQKIFVGTN